MRLSGLILPMRILHTADWHIKLGQKNVPKEWQENRFRMLFEKIYELEDDHDLHVISGDIFDRVPTLEELSLYFEFVRGCSKLTIITTGNHEAKTRKKSFLEYLNYATNNINKNVWISTEIQSCAEYGDFDTEFYLVPYECIKTKSTWSKIPEVPIFTHVRGAIEPHVKPEIDLTWLSKFPIVFAGDLHSHQNTQANIVYPGSPMTTSFHRSITKGSNGYISIDTSDNWSWKWVDFELPQLIRKTVTDPSEIVETEFHHTIYELEGSLDKVSQKVDNKLLDKKIVKRATEPVLILGEKMTMPQELEQYLTYVLDIKNVNDYMEAYYEYCNSEET